MDNKIVEYNKNINIINNKDLLIASLMEYICDIHKNDNYDNDNLFIVITNYLLDNKIITDPTIFTKEYSDYRYICQNMIKSIIFNNLNNLAIENNNNNFVVDKIQTNIYESRYNSDFVELEKLGSGGFGSVFKSYNKLDQCLYAIKKIILDNLLVESNRYFLNEIKNLSKLNHVNVVRYHTCWFEFMSGNPVLYIQMELCHLSLSKYLLDRNFNLINLDYELEKKNFMQIVNGLKYVHSKNIIHGDLNPDNIFIDQDGIIKIGDFGLSKSYEKDNTCVSNSYGNKLYMSPEQVKDKIISKKSDIYSLGIVFLELFVRFNTVTEKIISIDYLKNKKIIFKLDVEYKKLLIKMINDNPDKRISLDMIMI
jgi:serine/threonine protein kinase